ncbi:MAG: hypothetical protein GTN62_12655 [Gemmatimonadales bacterium]|nr:hypothetical protein [Gemmatimonadales bacterium]NIP08407.1 hypothetical protein [Gemmatimonadales bacterium]NIS65869.1 hypothetical protein [Gemmatimonadales bacterium]
MATHQVKITVLDGDFSYSHNPLRVDPGDSIEWLCDAGPFAVHLGWGTPCSKGRVRAGKGQKVGTAVRANAPNGTFKYMVAVNVDGDIYTDDPEIVVKPQT